MRKVMTLLAVGLLAAPLGLHAQPTDDSQDAPAFGARGMADPAGRVLALSEELGLTDEQVAEIERIQTNYRAANEPLLAQLRDARPQDGERGRSRAPRAEGERGDRARMRTRGGPGARMGERRAHMAAMRPVMREMRENRREAANEVATVLSAEQQALLETRREQQREAMRRGMREER